MGKGLICLIVFLLSAGTAYATPVTYFFTAGSAKLTGTAGTTAIFDTTVALDGVFVTFDAMVPEVIDFLITAPQTPSISTINTYGGFDTFVIESSTVSPGVGFSNLFIAPTGSNTWSFLAGPVDVQGVYSASNTSGTPPPVSNLPVPFVGSSFLNGSIDTNLMTFELLGVTLAQISGASFGEPNDLIVKADLTWVGVVPEPGTAVLLTCGLVGLAARRRKPVAG